MITGLYRLADLGVQISSRYPYIHDLCKDYVWQGEPDIRVSVTGDMIDYERKKARQPAQNLAVASPKLSEPYLESLAAYRAIAEQLPGFGGLLIHGSALAIDGQAVLFAAPSGVGKSTHARLWREQFGERVTMINDDKPLLRMISGQVNIYGTGWDGKHHLSSNCAAPLRAIFFIERSEHNRCTRLDTEQAFPLLLQQCYRPKAREGMLLTMALLEKLCEQLSIYRLQCNMDRQAALTAYSALQQQDI